MEADENENTLNTKTKPQPQQIVKKKEMNDLKHVFSFLFTQKEKETQQNDWEEFNDIINNIIQNENESYLKGEENIIERLIATYANVKNCNVNTLTKAKMKIAKNFGMLNDFGYHLQNLIELNLEGSEVKSIEDIGSSFTKLKILNVSKCGLCELTGIVCFTQLEEFNASFNFISDLVELDMCNTIQVLKLNDNKIEDDDNFIFLNNMNDLKQMTIRNNPVATKDKYIKWRITISNAVNIDVDSDYKI